MKFRQTLIVSLLLIVAFFTAQSFYSRKQLKAKPAPKVWFKGPIGHTVVCGPVFNLDDSTKEIPALKGWGHYEWKITTTSDSAQYYFNQGISMYYAFHTIEAIASFIKATRIDPRCAMAWYGKSLAMGPTINYPNGYAPPKGAYEASVKSKELMTNCTPLEKALIVAMQSRYSADTTISVKQLRINYADAMEKVYAKFPKNDDAVTLYADALLLLHPWDLYTHDLKPKPWTPKIQGLLEQALAIDPKNPGANHYYIHTMEGSMMPQLALKSAHLMDTLMPSVSHLTHMPSHIYIRTGDYQRGINDNDRAVAGYESYIKQYEPVTNGAVLYQYHNMHLGLNCAQMGGSYQTSVKAAKALQDLIPPFYMASKNSDGNYIQYVYTEPLFTAVRFGKWDDVLNTRPVDTLAYASLLQHFAKGLAWCAKGKLSMAEKELVALNMKIKDPVLKSPVDNFSTAYDAACVAQLILEGKIAESKKDYTSAIAILRKAVASEDRLIYNEPRDWPIPARQYLADVLLKAGKNTEAIAVLNKDLIINPHNGWALTGLALAYQNTRNTAEFKRVQQELKTAWKIKDLEITRPVF